MSEYIYMKKSDFDDLVERSLDLAEFHHDDIKELAALATIVPEWATHFVQYSVAGVLTYSERIKK